MQRLCTEVSARRAVTEADARASQELGPGRHAGGAGHPASRLMGLVRQRVFAHYLGTSALARRPSPPRSASPTSCRTSSARACSRRPSSRSTRGCSARADDEEADRVAERGLRAALAAGRGAGGPGHLRRAAHRRRGRARLRRPAGAFAEAVQLVAHPLPQHRAAGAVGVVPGGPQQPPASSSSPTRRRWSGTWRRSPSLVVAGPRVDEDRLTTLLAWGVVAGSALQFAVQLPVLWPLLGRFRPSLDDHQRRDAGRCSGASSPSWSPAASCRSARWWTPTTPRSSPRETVAVLGYTQLLALLPVSLFGMSVSAAELPELARETALGPEGSERLRTRIDRGLERIAFFVVPSAVAFLFLGDVLGGLLFQTGRFDAGGHPLALVPPDGLGGRPGGRDARAALRLGLLRAPGRTDTARLRLAPGGALRRPGLRVGAVRAGMVRRPGGDWRGGHHRHHRVRRLARVPPAPPGARPPHRKNRNSGPQAALVLGERARGRRPRPAGEDVDDRASRTGPRADSLLGVAGAARTRR